jgi:hypothetical protein
MSMSVFMTGSDILRCEFACVKLCECLDINSNVSVKMCEVKR